MGLTQISVIGLSAVLAWAVPQKPLVLITISKPTTYITQPLRKDGYVDYLAALNGAFGRALRRRTTRPCPS